MPAQHNDHAPNLYTRNEILVVFILALFVWLASTPLRSAFFLQIDTGAQDFVALSLTRNCFEFFTEKMLAVYFLTPTFWLFGASVYWETVWLAFMAAATTTLTYLLTRQFSPRQSAAIIAALLMTALPVVQFFNRTYFGYLLPFWVGAWLLVHHRRWFWAGVCFGWSFVGHFNMLVPLAFTALTLLITHLRHEPFHRWLAFAFGGLLPLAFTEGVFFFYLGHVYAFTWLRGIAGIVGVLSAPTQSVFSGGNWLWLWYAIVGSNGVALSALLMLAPITAWQTARQSFSAYPTLVAMSMVAIIGLLFYTIQAGLGTQQVIVSRSLLALYPPLVIGSALTLDWLAQFLDQHRPAALPFSHWATGLLTISLVLFSLDTALFIRAFTQTPYPAIVEWMNRADEEQRPVRYQGNWRLPLFLALRDGTEILINDTTWINLQAPNQAVLIFADGSPPTLPVANYTIERVAISNSVDARYPTLTAEATTTRTAELWWPSGPSQSVNPQAPTDIANASYYYDGDGCFTPPVYINRTLHFYELVLLKLSQWVGLSPQ